MAFVKRNLNTRIEKYLFEDKVDNNVLLLSGARQTGKTTLIKHILEGKKNIFVNLYETTSLPRAIDATETFEEFEKVLYAELNFKPTQGVVLVFDEAQEAKRLARWIHFFKERWVHQKVIVSGSILSNLFEEEVAYPVGRVEEIVLRPFSFREYLTAVNKEGLKDILEKSSLENPLTELDRQSFIKPFLAYLKTGGMPEIVIETNHGLENVRIAWDRLLRNYALDVERHMEDVYRSMFISALDRIADITCHQIKNSQIISTDSPSYRKLPHLLEVLEKWHLVHKVAAETKQPESAGGIASKRYIFDTGLANFLINHSQDVEWRGRSDAGNIAYPKLQETFVCNEIIAASAEPLSTLAYFKESRNSREIDFVFSASGKVFPLEVKSQSSVSLNSLTPMINFLKHENLDTGFLVYNGEMRKIEHRGKTIYAIPPYFVSELGRVVGQGKFPHQTSLPHCKE